MVAPAVVIVLLFLSGGCASVGPESIEEFVDGTVPDGSRGVVVAAQGDDLLLCDGWGSADDDADLPFGCDTVVDAMSMTKQFTAAAVLKLQMLGGLDVTDSIGHYLDDVPDDKQDITVAHLLTHTSALVEDLGGDYEPLDRDGLIAAAMDAPLQAAPGTTYAYSNAGYSLLAAIIDIASGTGYEQFLAEHLFGPAGMISTGYVLPDWTAHDVAVEYDEQSRDRGRPTERLWAQDGPYWNLRGNGGILSTARDMFRWHAALLGEDILNEEAKSQLFEPRVREEPDDTHYGYGWVITSHDEEPVAWHNGANDHAYGEFARTPDGSAMIFWTTSQVASDPDGWDVEELAPDLTGGMLERLM